MIKDNLMTIKETAERLALSPYTVKEMIRKREIEHVKINSRVSRVRASVLENFIKQRTIKTYEKKTTKTQKIPSQCIPSLARLRAL